ANPPEPAILCCGARSVKLRRAASGRQPALLLARQGRAPALQAAAFPREGDGHAVLPGDRDPAVLLLDVVRRHRVAAAGDQDPVAVHELEPVLPVRGPVDAAGHAPGLPAVDGGEDGGAPLLGGLAESLRLARGRTGPAPDRLAGLVDAVERDPLLRPLP